MLVFCEIRKVSEMVRCCGGLLRSFFNWFLCSLELERVILRGVHCICFVEFLIAFQHFFATRIDTILANSRQK